LNLCHGDPPNDPLEDSYRASDSRPQGGAIQTDDRPPLGGLGIARGRWYA